MKVCKKCNHEVYSEMRYCLMKNVCPSCGEALFRDSEVQHISLIKSKLLSQNFAQSMSEEDIFDISTFILSEFIKIKPEADNESELDAGPTGNVTISAENIKDEALLSKENLDDFQDENPLEEVGDEDFRIARLKRIAKETTTLDKPGAIVRRVR